jgi:hypothetical protein
MSLDGIPTYVLRGVGATIPFRLGAVPEAALLQVGGSAVSIDATKIVTIGTVASPRSAAAAPAATAAGGPPAA